MGVEKDQIKEILPIGDQLRAMISQSFLTGKHLRDLLSSKGVFIDENDKNKSVPLLMNTILSPKEFLKLVESQKTKEEKFKVNTLTLPCKTDKPLLDIIPPNFSINKIIKDNIVYKPNYKVKANPQFTYVGKDKKTFPAIPPKGISSRSIVRVLPRRLPLHSPFLVTRGSYNTNQIPRSDHPTLPGPTRSFQEKSPHPLLRPGSDNPRPRGLSFRNPCL